MGNSHKVDCSICHGIICAHCGFCADSPDHDDPKLREHLMRMLLEVTERVVLAQARTIRYRNAGFSSWSEFDLKNLAEEIARNSAHAILATIIGTES